MRRVRVELSLNTTNVDPQNNSLRTITVQLWLLFETSSEDTFMNCRKLRLELIQSRITTVNRESR